MPVRVTWDAGVRDLGQHVAARWPSIRSDMANSRRTMGQRGAEGGTLKAARERLIGTYNAETEVNTALTSIKRIELTKYARRIPTSSHAPARLVSTR